MNIVNILKPQIETFLFFFNIKTNTRILMYLDNLSKWYVKQEEFLMKSQEYFPENALEKSQQEFLDNLLEKFQEELLE